MATPSPYDNPIPGRSIFAHVREMIGRMNRERITFTGSVRDWYGSNRNVFIEADPDLTMFKVRQTGPLRVQFSAGKYGRPDVGYSDQVESNFDIAATTYFYARYDKIANTWQTANDSDAVASVLIGAASIPTDTAQYAYIPVAVVAYDTTPNRITSITRYGAGAVEYIDHTPYNCPIPYSGLIANIPHGYLLCDGTSGTPDLGTRFIVGYKSGDADYGSIGNTGGHKTHGGANNDHDDHAFDLSHVHALSTAGTAVVGGGICFEAATGDIANPCGDQNTAWCDSDITGANATLTLEHSETDNRPPYYTLAFIIRL